MSTSPLSEKSTSSCWKVETSTGFSPGKTYNNTSPPMYGGRRLKTYSSITFLPIRTSEPYSSKHIANSFIGQISKKPKQDLSQDLSLATYAFQGSPNKGSLGFLQTGRRRYNVDALFDLRSPGLAKIKQRYESPHRDPVPLPRKKERNRPS